jgi:hypothetical protein
MRLPVLLLSGGAAAGEQESFCDSSSAPSTVQFSKKRK